MLAISTHVEIGKSSIDIVGQGLVIWDKAYNYKQVNLEKFKKHLENYIKKDKLSYLKDKALFERKLRGVIQQYFSQAKKRMPVLILHLH